MPQHLRNSNATPCHVVTPEHTWPSFKLFAGTPSGKGFHLESECSSGTFIEDYLRVPCHWHWGLLKPGLELGDSVISIILSKFNRNEDISRSLKLRIFSEEMLLLERDIFVDGHTDSMMIPHIKYKGKTIVFMADLLPSVGHIPLPYVMGYDTRPLLTLNEKAKFLNTAADNDYVLFFEHDSINECCTLKHTEKGVRLKESFSFNQL